MAKKARLSLYLEDEELKRQIKVAAAKRGMTVTDYCADAIGRALSERAKEAWLRASPGTPTRSGLSFSLGWIGSRER